MLTLAFDTATDCGSVALGEAGEVLGATSFTDRTHAAALVPAALRLLDEAQSSFRQVTRVVVGNGPGSFTGIRIGFATAYGIRRSLPAVELLTVPSITAAACAIGRREGGVVAAVYDALRGDVFAAAYRFDGASMETVADPALIPLPEIADRFPEVDCVTGERSLLGVPAVRDWIPEGLIYPIGPESTAAEMLHLARSGRYVTAVGPGEGFSPDYGRLAEAQVRWEREYGVELPHR